MIFYMGDTFSPVSLGTTREAVQAAVERAKRASAHDKELVADGIKPPVSTIDKNGVTVVIQRATRDK